MGSSIVGWRGDLHRFWGWSFWGEALSGFGAFLGRDRIVGSGWGAVSGFGEFLGRDRIVFGAFLERDRIVGSGWGTVSLVGMGRDCAARTVRATHTLRVSAACAQRKRERWEGMEFLGRDRIALVG
jgi:hypothetical protein